MKTMRKFRMKVKDAHIESLMAKVKVSFYRFPGTNSTVAHASLDGWELAICSAPAADARQYNEQIGQMKSKERVLIKAREKLWETESDRMYDRLNNNVGSDVDFRNRYADIYDFFLTGDAFHTSDAS